VAPIPGIARSPLTPRRHRRGQFVADGLQQAPVPLPEGADLVALDLKLGLDIYFAEMGRNA
jgi:hypothetical protein